MRDWGAPGVRPFGFWFSDVSGADRRRALKACTTEAEMVIFLGLADEAEKQAITTVASLPSSGVRRSRATGGDVYARRLP